MSDKTESSQEERNYAERKDHVDYLRTLGISEEALAIILADASEEYADYQESVVMRYAWECVVDPELEPGWLSNTACMLAGEGFDGKKSHISFYDESESEWNALQGAVKTLQKTGVDEEALLTLIRACQKNVLGNFFQLVDGGWVGHFSLFESRWQNNKLEIGRSFADMEDFFIEYDPKNLNKTKPT